MTLAEQLIEQCISEARTVPSKLEIDAQRMGGRYAGYVDACYMFEFKYEYEAVDFMNLIDVDLETKVDCGSSMNADLGRYLVYVPADKYNPEPHADSQVDPPGTPLGY